MVHPLFEHSLLLYLSARYWRAAHIVFPFQIILCTWVRIIFVIVAYENVRGHTAGFLGLQIVIVTVWLLSQHRLCY